MNPLIPIGAGLAALVLIARSSKAGTKTGVVTSDTTGTPDTGGIPAGFPCPPAGTPDAGVDAIPVYGPALRLTLNTATSADALALIAAQLSACGQSKAAAEFNAKAASLGGSQILAGTPTLGGSGQFASNPATQWRGRINPGDNAIFITSKFFGNGSERTIDNSKYRYVELIQANPDKPTVGNPANPISSKYNWASLMAGEHILIPKSWNPWVNETGTILAHNPTSFPPRP